MDDRPQLDQSGASAMRIRLLLPVSAALFVLATMAASRAHADPEPTVLPVEGARTDLADPNLEISPWAAGKPRLFASSRIDAGVGYGKVQVAAGYGLPHWAWVGVEAYPISTFEFAGVYAGLRGSLPFLDLAIGVRDSASYRRGFLQASPHHTHDELDQRQGDRAHYVDYEATLSGALPAPGGFAVWEASLFIVDGAPAGVHLYEESMRAIMQPPKIAFARLGYVLGLGPRDAVKIGALGEAVFLPGRDTGPVYRIGPALQIVLTDHLEALGLLTMAVKSPDELGFFLSAYGILGLRWKWATGETKPGFP